MNQTTIPYAAPLQAARDLLATGLALEAESACMEALGLMQPSMSANNPKLADAYGLHAEICAELARFAGGQEEHESWVDRAIVSQGHKLDVLDNGMTDANVMMARLHLAGLLSAREKFVEAAAELETARTVVSDLLEAGAPDVSILNYLETSYMLAEALTEVSRESEAAAVLTSSFNKLRPEHYREAKVMKAVTMVSALLAAILEEAEAETSAAA